MEQDPTTPSDSVSPAGTVIITIDGPAGTGKSTVAHQLARRLGLEFLDTGAMYRAAALIAIESDLAPEDGARIAVAVGDADMHFDWDGDPPRLMLGPRDVTRRIRDKDVAGAVSIVAAQAAVREVLVDRQRRIAEAHPRLVTEGRDQGSVVFPDAPVRFFLDAHETVRARRRSEQLAAAGRPVDAAEVIVSIRERDRIDSTRTDGPLIRPPGAIVVDTSERTVAEVVETLVTHVRGRLPEAVFDR